ncbi:hypothetical protein [Rhizobium lusitanum]|nr:hypothetical protein [Rhizobium lusitanum]
MSINYAEIGRRWISIWNDREEAARNRQLTEIWASEGKPFCSWI